MAKEKPTPKPTALEQFEMTMEEAKAYRAALHVPKTKKLNDMQKREAFRIWWAGNKKKYGRSQFLEYALWLHLKTIGMDSPENFEKGIFNFGLSPAKKS